MSKKGLKENQIFAARDTVEENDKIKAAREAIAADPTNAEKYMALGLALRGQMFFREALEAYSIGLTYDPFMSLLYRHRGHAYVIWGSIRKLRRISRWGCASTRRTGTAGIILD